ncbi:class I SAM-dependent methyltransferase [Isoptericola sp. NEAU-Y5]|uniref:Class I SAM-dependent methyltransferase n=1 Tax=Isoptericola luteus TaxID=2879484 RepID=A0ABS7ZDG9_9MICO|nr:class I SAM-dependent methyltransferase [Isoptericola sp. NEAU-Y5]MCA5891815.1 class I SAM-dependent methyltransferase [Isoptericola sp. NEAU-Y5]
MVESGPQGHQHAGRPDDAVRLYDDVRADEADKPYLPGMSSAWKMPWYDVLGWWHRAGRLHRRTVELAGISAGQHVLDVGCGTGNLLLTVLDAVPDAVVTGLDPDGDALLHAARKARRRVRRRRHPGQVTLVRGYADRLPAADASLDHVVSSLALHHVPMAEKERFAAELVRTLRPGGVVTIVDLDAHGDHGQDGAHQHDGKHATQQHHHRHEHEHEHKHEIGQNQYRADNAEAGIQRLLTAAGLVDAHEVARATFMDTPAMWVQARRP